MADDGAEQRLLQAARAGDGTAFADLVSPYRTRLWAVCLRITSDRQDAEDALQDALIAAWHHLGSFRGEARLSTWLHRIAANAALAVVRRRRDIPVEVVPEDGRLAGADVAEGVTLEAALVAALRELPEEFRVALVLREYGDFTYAEIAEHQGIPVQTVKSRLNRARAGLAALNLG